MSAPLQMQCSSFFEDECSSPNDDGNDQQVIVDAVVAVPSFDVDSDLVASRLSVMRSQESGPYLPPGDGLSPSRVAAAAALHPSAAASVAARGKRPVDVTCRTKMVDWCYTISDYCKFDRDVVSVAFSLLDRYITTPTGCAILFDRNLFQLASMTALYTAVKIHEAEVMGPDVIAGLSRGNYTVDQVVAMERDMLVALGWRTSPPTPSAFLSHFFALLPDEAVGIDARAALFDSAKYQAQLAVREYELSAAVRPSAVAYASLINAFSSEATGIDRSLGGFLNMIGVIAGAFDEERDDCSVDEPSLEAVQRKLLVAYTGDAEVEIPPSPCRVAAVSSKTSLAMREQWLDSCHRSSPRCVSQRELQVS